MGIEDIFIKNTKISSIESIKKPIVPKKITALIHFGRSGTGLLHSLIDGHPEISTLPSIYFSEFFDYSTWKRIIAGGWEEMAERFTEIFAVLFDASSTIKIPTKNPNYINIGEPVNFFTIVEAALLQNETALGYRFKLADIPAFNGKEHYDIVLNPTKTDLVNFLLQS